MYPASQHSTDFSSHASVDAEMIQDTDRFKMDLIGGLQRSLGEKVKASTYLMKFMTMYVID